MIVIICKKNVWQSVVGGVKVLDIHETIKARVEAERQRRIEEVHKETIANAIATVKARLEAEAAARQQTEAPGKTCTPVNLLTPSKSQ